MTIFKSGYEKYDFQYVTAMYQYYEIQSLLNIYIHYTIIILLINLLNFVVYEIENSQTSRNFFLQKILINGATKEEIFLQLFRQRRFVIDYRFSESGFVLSHAI